MKLLGILIVLGFVCASNSAFAAEPGEIVFLSTKTDIKGCYFKKGEEAKKAKFFKNTFSYGEKVCMRAYTTGKIGREVNMQDFWNTKFYKGYVFSWNHPKGDSGFWVVRNALAETKPLPRGKHCVQMYVTGPNAQGVKPKGRRLAAKGCFTVQ